MPNLLTKSNSNNKRRKRAWKRRRLLLIFKSNFMIHFRQPHTYQSSFNTNQHDFQVKQKNHQKSFNLFTFLLISFILNNCFLDFQFVEAQFDEFNKEEEPPMTTYISQV